MLWLQKNYVSILEHSSEKTKESLCKYKLVALQYSTEFFQKHQLLWIKCASAAAFQKSLFLLIVIICLCPETPEGAWKLTETTLCMFPKAKECSFGSGPYWNQPAGQAELIGRRAGEWHNWLQRVIISVHSANERGSAGPDAASWQRVLYQRRSLLVLSPGTAAGTSSARTRRIQKMHCRAKRSTRIVKLKPELSVALLNRANRRGTLCLGEIPIARVARSVSVPKKRQSQAVPPHQLAKWE